MVAKASTTYLLFLVFAALLGGLGIALVLKQWPLRAWMVLFAIGASLAGYGLVQFIRSRRALAWGPISATVLQTSVGEVFVPGKGGGYVEYFPVVRFRYESSGGSQESERFSPAAQDYREHDRSAVVRLLEAYGVGAQVTAFAPSSSREPAVLQRRVSPRLRSQYLAILVGGLLVLGVSLVVRFVLRP